MRPPVRFATERGITDAFNAGHVVAAVALPALAPVAAKADPAQPPPPRARHRETIGTVQVRGRVVRVEVAGDEAVLTIDGSQVAIADPTTLAELVDALVEARVRLLERATTRRPTTTRSPRRRTRP